MLEVSPSADHGGRDTRGSKNVGPLKTDVDEEGTALQVGHLLYRAPPPLFLLRCENASPPSPPFEREMLPLVAELDSCWTLWPFKDVYAFFRKIQRLLEGRGINGIRECSECTKFEDADRVTEPNRTEVVALFYDT